MSLEQYAYLAEIIGVIVVTVTLIYLAIQVRQGADLLRSEARQAQANNDLSAVFKMVEYPDLGRLFCQEETPSLTEKSRLMFWIIGQMRAREHEWLQFQSGAMDEATWLSYRDVIYFLLGTRRARDFWDLTKAYFNPDFAKMVEDMMEGIPETDYWERLEAIR